MNLLKQYRAWYLEEKLKQGSRWIDTNYLFVKENGRPMHPESITRWLSKFSKKHNLPHINPHAFRHSQASILVYNKVDIVTISKRLGHAKVSTTTDIYSHKLKNFMNL